MFSSRNFFLAPPFCFCCIEKVANIFPRFSVLFLLYFPMAAIGYGVLGSEAGSNIIYSLAPGPAKVKKTRITFAKPHCKETIPKIRNNYSHKRNAPPQSQFPHSCGYGRFIYSHDQSAFSPGGNMWTAPGNIKITHRDMNVKVGLRPRNSQKGIHKWDFLCSA